MRNKDESVNENIVKKSQWFQLSNTYYDKVHSVKIPKGYYVKIDNNPEIFICKSVSFFSRFRNQSKFPLIGFCVSVSLLKRLRERGNLKNCQMVFKLISVIFKKT